MQSLQDGKEPQPGSKVELWTVAQKKSSHTIQESLLIVWTIGSIFTGSPLFSKTLVFMGISSINTHNTGVQVCALWLLVPPNHGASICAIKMALAPLSSPMTTHEIYFHDSFIVSVNNI